jgi:hypothetical protein
MSAIGDTIPKWTNKPRLLHFARNEERTTFATFCSESELRKKYRQDQARGGLKRSGIRSGDEMGIKEIGSF